MGESKDQQVRYVVEGAALSVLAARVEALSAVKTTLELNFNSVWRRWGPAKAFPSLARAVDPGNLFYLALHRSEGRRWGAGRWQIDGPWARPCLAEGWELSEIEECLEQFADERASADEWRRFGELYVGKFQDGEIQRQ
ncbi:hypothetical protein [Amycolatopsis dendrobii]|uniref:Uncharacterized protein n=1 Tax=Amycolatopsis dendrobii TaxID=2760662 RepID=A0A7W3W3G0_9PSEU|nr:hypothetical protein [Amycolatopsis dendrobii]MBB1158139.1 hypothetical protein [Amycolatopsis dendrobii]